MFAPTIKLALHAIRVLWALLAPVDPQDAEGLRVFANNTYPAMDSPMTSEKAFEHFYYARVASAIYQQDVHTLLAFGKHESNFEQHAITREVGNKMSCGVTTPIPTYSKDECERQTSSLLAGYSAGAEHLRGWYQAGDVRSQIEALRGVGGGYRLIRACREHPVYRDRAPYDDLCNIGNTFLLMRGSLIESIKRAHKQAVGAS